VTEDLQSPEHVPGRQSAEAAADQAGIDEPVGLPETTPQRASAVTFLIAANALTREGLRRIQAETVYHPIALASCMDEIASVHTHEGGMPVYIMDADHDHDESCRQTGILKDRNPEARVLMLVEAYSARQVLAAFDAGADAYLLKSVSCEVLLKTLDLVLLGETVFPAKTLGTLRNKGPAIGIGSADVLSERERAIIRCIVAGDPNKLIARKLNIAETTVKVHLRAILRKICVKNRTQAAVWGMRHLPPDDGPAEEVEAAC